MLSARLENGGNGIFSVLKAIGMLFGYHEMVVNCILHVVETTAITVCMSQNHQQTPHEGHKQPP